MVIDSNDLRSHGSGLRHSRWPRGLSCGGKGVFRTWCSTSPSATSSLGHVASALAQHRSTETAGGGRRPIFYVGASQIMAGGTHGLLVQQGVSAQAPKLGVLVTSTQLTNENGLLRGGMATAIQA